MSQRGIQETQGRSLTRLCRTLLIGAAVAGSTLPVAATLQPVSAEELVVGKRMSVYLERNKGRLIKLSEPAVTVFVADPAIADIQIKSPTLVYIFGKSTGQTTFIAVGKEEKVLVSANVTVAHNLSRLNGIIRAVLPGSKIRVRSIDGAIVLTGTVNSPAEAESARALAAKFVASEKDVITHLKMIGPNQIMLRVRIVEMSRQALRNLGIDWNGLIQQGGLLVGLVTSAGAAALPLGALTNNFRGTNFSISALVTLLESKGLVRTLAEPNLTAMSGQTAHFLAGGEFPVPVPQGNNVITIEFKKFGVGLSFTPVILGGNRISLKVAPEVSQLSSNGAIELNGIKVSALTTRRAETSVELGSGQSFVIAGLLQRSTTTDLSKIPGAGDVPIIGKLFRSEKFQRNETELVIIVTPYIVKPISGKPPARRLAAATTRAPHADPRRIFAGTPRKAARRKATGTHRLSGKVGFILE